MREAQAYVALGFVRLGDYVSERLGVSLRGAQEMMRVDEALEALPVAGAAFEAGAITAGHVRLLTRVATPGDEAWWVALARRMHVKEFARVVAARQRECSAGATCAGTPGSGDGDVGACVGSAVSGTGDDNRDADDCAGMAGAAAGDAGIDSDTGEPDERIRHDVVAPAWMASWWRDTAAIVRRLAGSAMPAGEAFGLVVAEVAAGLVGSGGDAGKDALLKSSGDEAQADASCELPPCASSPSPSLVGDATVRFPENVDTGPSGLPPSAPSPATHVDTPSRTVDARELDRELRALLSERRRQDALLADHLRRVGVDRGYRIEGFPSLEAYAAETFSLPARSLYRLLALGRSFERVPSLRRTFLTGRLTARQVVLVGRVATRVTFDAWIRRAEAVSLRRLEDEIDLWEHLKVTRPSVWERLDGFPLPEDLSLAPGCPPRLPASALASNDTDRRDEEESRGAGRISASAFLQALEADEAAEPLPGKMSVIKLWLEPGVRDQWLAMVDDLRFRCVERLEEWEALALVLRRFADVWDNRETRRQRRENPILERDGWRCMVPWCRSMGTGRLHVHHLIRRSEGGTDAPWNLITLCAACHLRLLHDGRIRVTGRAPDDLLWELGREPGRDPFAVFRGNEKVYVGEGQDSSVPDRQELVGSTRIA
ncbi:MAG TPA: HNH endonuclease [Candidatus Saccharimonadales bacterium]|nr:HNH endonuclease [Candidatus Saccharimonadales bacterium]